jgi:hypothetical protein
MESTGPCSEPARVRAALRRGLSLEASDDAYRPAAGSELPLSHTGLPPNPGAGIVVWLYGAVVAWRGELERRGLTNEASRRR